jgi:hypothetical protein
MFEECLADKKLRREGRLKTEVRDLRGANAGMKHKAQLNRIDGGFSAYRVDVGGEYREIQFWGNSNFAGIGMRSYGQPGGSD